MAGDESVTPWHMLLTPAEVVRMLQIDNQKLTQMRDSNEGPTFHRLGGRLIRYDARDVQHLVRRNASDRGDSGRC